MRATPPHPQRVFMQQRRRPSRRSDDECPHRERARPTSWQTFLRAHWGAIGRCCTNRHGPARCQPTRSSPADAVRHWSAEGGHPIQDLTAEDGLTPLPSWTSGAKAIADDGLVAEERILHPALAMVP